MSCNHNRYSRPGCIPPQPFNAIAQAVRDALADRMVELQGYSTSAAASALSASGSAAEAKQYSLDAQNYRDQSQQIFNSAQELVPQINETAASLQETAEIVRDISENASSFQIVKYPYTVLGGESTIEIPTKYEVLAIQSIIVEGITLQAATGDYVYDAATRTITLAQAFPEEAAGLIIVINLGQRNVESPETALSVLASASGAGLVGTASGNTVQNELNTIYSEVDGVQAELDSLGNTVDLILPELAKPIGASLIGVNGGNNAQEAFDALNSKIESVSKPATKTPFTNQVVIGVTDREGEASAAIKADAGKTDGAFPQCVAVDPVTGEYFISRGWDDTTPTYVHIYNAKMEFQTVVKAGGGFSEGIVIGYVNGERRIALSTAGTGYAVYSLPATKDITDLNSATLLFTQNSANHASQMNSYGNFVIIMLNNNSRDQYIRRGIYSVFGLQDFLTTADPTRLSWVQFPFAQLGGSVSDNPTNQGGYISKGQAVCIHPNGVAAYAGSMWNTSRDLPGNVLRFVQVGHGGGVISNQCIYPKLYLEELNKKGWTRPNGNPLDNTEAEGLTYKDGLGFVWMTIVSERVFITASEQGVNEVFPAKNVLDLNRAVKPIGVSEGSYSTVSDIVGYNSIDGSTMSTPDQIVDFMRYAGISDFTCTCKIPLTFGTETYNSVADRVKFELIDGINVVATVRQGRSRVRSYQASGNTPRTWAASAVITGGADDAELNGRNGVITISPNDFPQISFTASGTGTNTPLIFKNKTNGTIGTITNSATGTTYNATSDVRRKDDKGAIEDPLGLLDQMVKDKAFRVAAYKTEPDNAYPMFMAQALFKTLPFAVTQGGKDSAEDPWMVDYSKVTPVLFAMVAALKDKIEELETKLETLQKE